MGNYLIPANSKKSLLIFGFFTWRDIIVFSIGAVTTVLLLLIFTTNDIYQTLIMCIPLIVSLFLVMPVPNYHNVMTLVGNVFSFYTNRRRYYWKGWCVKDGFGRDYQDRK